MIVERSKEWTYLGVGVDRAAGTANIGDTVLEVTKVHLNAGITGKGKIEIIINIPNLKKIPITRIAKRLNGSARPMPAKLKNWKGSYKSV